MKDIYTIGYSGFKLNDFIQVLKKYNINGLIDVRSNPASQFYPDYNMINMQKVLDRNNIIYRSYKSEFGARQEDLRYYTDGYLDFSKYRKSESFLEGVRKIEAGLKHNYTFAFMCAEKDPSTCHRNIMVAKKFYDLGYNIKNILSDGSIEPQDSIERRLVEQYFPNRNQISFFSEGISWEEMVKKSYEYRNIEIGYRMYGEDEDIEVKAL